LGYIEEIRAIVGHRPIILVGAVVIVIDNYGQILLQQRKHPEGYWAIPGGLMELTESTEETARRELFEETKLKIGELMLINVYSGPQNYIKAQNGDEFYVVTTAYYSTDYRGELLVDKSESLDFKFYNVRQLPNQIVKSHKVIINEFMDKFYNKIF
jgi:ADP-ribose pyrophosphatase YjhB (NUDIX family)